MANGILVILGSERISGQPHPPRLGARVAAACVRRLRDKDIEAALIDLMRPVLSDLLNHFGSSLFSYKPSAVVTYSAEQWGGTRAAVSMRTSLSELGCLPVSAMIHEPHAQDVFEKAGEYRAGVEASRWDGYLDRTLNQIRWWSTAAARQRTEGGERPGAFVTNPSERNAP